MGKETGIQWCDSTVNPTMGCDGCELWNTKTKKCYAGRLHQVYPNHKGFSPQFEILTTFPGRMEKAANWSDLTGKDREGEPWLKGLPRLVFVSDMSDALSKDITFEYLEEEVIKNVLSKNGQRHCWLWLTKQPRRMAKFSKYLEDKGTEWPANIWVGTSITTVATLTRVNELSKVGNEKTIKFLSVEPQWEEIKLDDHMDMVNWVIQGGESGKASEITPFKLEWAYSISESCKKAGVPYFLKQLGRVSSWKDKILELADTHGGEWDEWPLEDLKIRQFPHPTKKGIFNGRL